jgi:hypothetical protein
MNHDQCLRIAREEAMDCPERHDYMPKSEMDAASWKPHQWVVDAMQRAAVEAERERDQYRAGNTALLTALMYANEDKDDANALRGQALREAGMLNEDGSCNWLALEARKPKQQTWAEAVNECISDPAERARLLAMEDDAPQ